jgi:triosephosphate isomerase (TIM)
VRKPLVVGNWKMNTTQQEASSLIQNLLPRVAPVVESVDVVVCPPFPWLTDVARLLAGSGIGLGAQNTHTETGGAYTGEVSVRMLKGLCQYVLVGQYERRILYSEKDAIVRRKLQAAQQDGLKPILCVGEDADQLDEGLGPYIVGEQIEADLEGANLDEPLVIAYDPAWTTMGLVAPPPVSYAGEIVVHMRETLASLFSPRVAEQARLLYGGSVSPRNIADIAAIESIDGVLAGTASLNAANFSTLVHAFVSPPSSSGRGSG